MNPETGKALIGATGNVVGGVIGMIGQRKREKRAMQNQERLMDIQQRNQMNLNTQGSQLQKDMWDYTNYENQVKHLDAAGLNRGLIYGMSGGGGTTTGSQGGGKCMECRKQKMRAWQVRLSEELKENNECEFVTLTFSDESLREIRKKVWEQQPSLKGYELDNAIASYAVRHFLERWRKSTGKSVRHWLVTELGTTKTERLHLHGLIWSKDKEMITGKWQYGIVGYGKYVNEKTINYIVKYVNKGDIVHREYQSIVLTSKGMGKDMPKA